MKYYATFKSDGTRIISYIEGIHDDIPSDAIEISDEDQELYCTGEYVRDMKTGLPLKKPAYLQTQRDIYAGVNTVYSTKLKQISDAIQQATARGDNAVVAKLQSTYTATNAEWKTKLNAVI